MTTFTHKQWLSSSALMASVLLVGCQTVPIAEEEASPSVEVSTAVVSETLPELNIPDSLVDASCDCSEVVAEPEETYFDRGVRALAARDYAQALSYFERHADAESDNAQREAEIGLALSLCSAQTAPMVVRRKHWMIVLKSCLWRCLADAA